MTWRDVVGPFLVVPVGSCEQHGPHLPLDTDTVIATALAEHLAGRRDDCVVAPAITITASGEHAGFPGTLSIGNDVMASVIIEVVRSATWARGVVLVNGHGGNAAAMATADAVFTREGRSVLTWWPRVADGDLHAGHTETSLMLSLAPGDVRLDRLAAGTSPTVADLVRDGVLAHSPNGVLGDPTTATAAAGERIFAEIATRLIDAVDGWVG